mgnify:CR=1 FL=1
MGGEPVSRYVSQVAERSRAAQEAGFIYVLFNETAEFQSAALPRRGGIGPLEKAVKSG